MLMRKGIIRTSCNVFGDSLIYFKIKMLCARKNKVIVKNLWNVSHDWLIIKHYLLKKEICNSFKF